MNNRISYLSILLISFLACKTEVELKAPSQQPDQASEMDSLGMRYLELERFSGVILVQQGDSIIYNNSFGLADYDNPRAFTHKTAFKIGELSELVTANMIRQMAADGQLELSAPVSQYLPTLEAEYTINDLLNHNTALPAIKTIKEQNPRTEYSTLKYALLALQSPDTSSQSELDYNLLGLLIENISGKSYEENLKDYATTLGLENTYFKKQDTDMAVGYLYQNYRGNGLELQKSPVYDLNIAFSSTGLKATAKDLMKIITSSPEGELDRNGYLENDGFSYAVRRDSKDDLTIVVLSNRKHPVSGELANSISAILQGKKYRLPLRRNPFDIEKELLKEYSGSYALNPTVNLEVTNGNDSLFVMMGPNKVHLIPQSRNQFYMAQNDAALRFLRDSTGSVSEVELLNGFLEGNRINRTK